MTQLLFQTDSYLSSFSAKVIEIDDSNHGLVLDKSAFYPGGGGQPNDTGNLLYNNEVLPVERVKKANERLIHYIPSHHLLPPIGRFVEGEIDWDRRYKLMRTHTAMHILCGVIFRDYAASVTGGDMEPLKGRMDFEFETMHKDMIESIEVAVNKEVRQARPVKVDILPREVAFKIPDLIRTKINLLPPGIQQIRVVEIVGLDIQADGGTHVRNTAEVGRMRITDYKSKGKINKRIYIELDE